MRRSTASCRRYLSSHLVNTLVNLEVLSGFTSRRSWWLAKHIQLRLYSGVKTVTKMELRYSVKLGDGNATLFALILYQSLAMAVAG
jgi:hypothetical protein